ncbi:hypothetical protein [Glycomyces buryatensis]|uniref:Uncharacterized protein n=1 Tax=Glycomyces buryatensis TaxID=2570927 RepID=A0A4S8QCD8_9ACTN|nr:hypothetical protein [Glycomyces buryatensis]THV41960.1 hypothetical protein FAB82_08485 [Glycomyces buryatensis]
MDNMTEIPAADTDLTRWQRFRNALADWIRVPEHPSYDEKTWLKILKAPSDRPGLKFKISLYMTVKYGDSKIPDDRVTALAETAVYRRCVALSEDLSLTDSEQLHFLLNSELPIEQHIPGQVARVSARCAAIEVNQAELSLVQDAERAQIERHRDQLEQDRIEQRMDFLSKALADPRTAVSWRLAEAPGEIDALRKRTDAFIELDERLEVYAKESVTAGDSRSCLRLLGEFLHRHRDGSVWATAKLLIDLFRNFGEPELEAEARKVLGANPR